MKQSKYIRMISLVLTAALLFQIVPLNAFALETDLITDSEDISTELISAEDTTVLGEIAEYRDESEKHFRMSDGSFIAVNYGMPVHYTEDGEEWIDIDNTLVLQNQSGDASVLGMNSEVQSGYLAENGDDIRTFADTLASGFVFSAEHCGKSISVSLIDNDPDWIDGAAFTNDQNSVTTTDQADGIREEDNEMIVGFNRESVAQITNPNQNLMMQSQENGLELNSFGMSAGTFNAEENDSSFTEQIMPLRLRSQVLYPDVYPGVDLLYALCSYNVKESIVVKERLSDYSFIFRLELKDLAPAFQDDGSILFEDENNNGIYWIPAPYMVDGNGERSEAVLYTLTQDGDAWLLNVSADPNWINAEERQFPVVIDPTLIDYTTASTFTGTVVSQNSNSVSAVTNLACGYHPTHGMMEIYYKLNSLPDIPIGSTLVRAYAGFYQNDYRSGTDSTSGKMVLYMSPITVSANLNSTMTWSNRPSYGEYLDFVESSYSTVGSILYWDVTDAAKKWYNDSNQNYGLVMTSNASSSTKYRTWFSYEDKVAFIASYRNTTGIEPYYTYQTAGVGNAGTAYISDFTGQLTISKQLVSYASNVNPFSLELIYNSSYAVQYGMESYDVGGNLGLKMHIAAGTGLNIMQKIDKVQLQNDASSTSTTTYLKYTDGDGTVHYFAKDASRNSSYYYDEDGLGLKITEFSSGSYKMSDDVGNVMTFINGFLTTIADANGNEIQIHYLNEDGSQNSNGHPSSYNSRINKVVQKNNGGTEITVATFGYSTTKWLQTITDAEGNVYTINTEGGRLKSISRKEHGTSVTTVIAQYGPASTQLSYAYDAEAGYGIAFTYGSDKKVSSYYEITSASTSNKPGVIVEISHLNSGQTLYRDYGKNRTKDTDDILTYYTFDYAGRSVNVYTTDTNQKILGASNAVYSGVGTTDKANNRTLRTSSIGMTAMNELRNYGFEAQTTHWTLVKDGTNTNLVVNTEKPRTGQYSLKGWINTSGTNTVSVTRTTDTLYANKEYTLSVYVNTAQCTSFKSDGIYLQVTNGSTNIKSDYLNYQTSSTLDDGWVRLSVTFTPGTQGTYTIGLYNKGVGPTFYVDDFQLEQSGTPSSLNLLETGNMQYWGNGWTFPNYGSFYEGDGMPSATSTKYALKIPGDAYTENYAYQDVPIYQTGKTYVLSGWAKANAAPDNVSTNSDPAQDKYKQFGLRAIITYSDNTTEYHYAPFNSDVKEWQYVSTTIVPKKATTKVKTIRVVCAYERNENTVLFDNICLSQEVAQTMGYDADGNLTSVKSTGNSKESGTYSSGNLQNLNTGGNGIYNFTYDSKHNLLTAKNGIITETMTYDAYGNVLTSAVTPNSGSNKIITTNTYTNNGNLLSTVKQRGAFTTTYSYSNTRNKMYGLPSSISDPFGHVVNTTYDVAGRTMSTNIKESGSALLSTVDYTYDSGMLKSLKRTASGKVQSYTFGYDDFGNMETIQVGGKTLVTYTYEEKNGQLKKLTYANQDNIGYVYDDLNRITQTSYNNYLSSVPDYSYSYQYNGDGNLYSISGGEVNGTQAKYLYQYDSIGRLIGTSQTGGNGNIRAGYTYDESNRLTSITYHIPGIVDTGTQTMYYNTNTSDSIADGALTSMALFSNSWLYYRYDNMTRLTERDVGEILTEHRSYLAGSGTCTTTGLVENYYTTAKGSTTKLSGWKYEYNAVGNITKATSLTDSTYWSYTYDALGQLKTATLYNSSGAAQQTYNYSYDNAGNLLSRTVKNSSGAVTESGSYTYGDSNWADLLKTYNNAALEYDANGNPTTYQNGREYKMTWENGRQLAKVVVGGVTYTYKYDMNGLRTYKKNSDGGHTKYFIVDGLTVAEQRFNSSGSEMYTLRYLFDESNSPIGFGIQYPTDASSYWVYYYFAKNLQGDVVAIYQYGSSPTLIAKYTYDPYGQILSVTNASGTAIAANASHVANYNPFRYRGYHYDADTGFYYLRSRYYDPAIGRFINADSYVSTGQGFIGLNMFAYCGNNPIVYSDPTGSLFLVDDITLILVACYGIAVFAIIMSPPVQQLIWDLLNGAITSIDTFIQEVGYILEAKQKGKQRVRHTEYDNLTNEEVSQRAHDPKTPSDERKKLLEEEKGRGIRNRKKRKEVYGVKLEG